ncbi:hypothetical protein ED733_008067 [Metarhizium rileyi]|uniref:Glycosyltransferase family 31 protein n=1 Tax=Metarhizium rileyi (strain RCEF 4871) TaxID=1649241 RepID=A0A5C6GIX7_METRR|nr:hypothetical protein ED733_008067 [Metarhizium rileyi]
MLLSKGLPVLQVRLGHLLLMAVAFGLLFHATTLYRQERAFTFDVRDTTPVGDLLPEEEYLERLIDRYALTNLTKWQAWRVQSTEQSLAMGSTTEVHADFQPELGIPKVIDVANPTPADLRASKGLELPVHIDKPRDQLYASMFLIGISTSYERIVAKDQAILRAWKRWLAKSDGTSNGASLVLMLDNATEEQLDDLDRELEKLGIDVYTTSTAEPTSRARRYHELIRVMKSYGATIAASGQEKRWFGVVEDTVFFPSLSYLQERLSTYDFSKQLHIGIPSERSDWQQDGDSVTTYGGGAIFLTQKAVSLLPKLSCLELDAATKHPFRAQRWDAVLKQCLEQKTGIDMHVIPAFYSPHDGNYESHLESHETGKRPLLLHNYQDRHRLDVGMAHLVTDACGEACFMHQYRFHDNWVIINGVSISHHPDGLGHHRGHGSVSKSELSRDTKETPISGQIVLSEDENEIESKPLKWKGRRDVWKLLDSAKASDGTIWQAYARKEVQSANDASGETIDSIIVLIWQKKRR